MEQESRIVRQMKDYHSGNEELRQKAIDEIVADHSPYIHRVINHWFPTFRKEYGEDMFQEGAMGIIKGLEKYDPAQSKPTTFFHYYILHDITEYIAKIIHGTSAYCASTIKTINRAIQQLESDGNTDPTPTDLAIVAGMRIDAVKRAMDARLVSQTHSCGDEEYMDSLLSTCQEGPDAALEEKERTDTLRQAIMSLPKIERTIIVLKYGLYGYEKKSHAEIAKQTGISVAKIRYYQQSAIRKLRKNVAMKNVFSDYSQASSVKKISFSETSVAERQMSELEKL